MLAFVMGICLGVALGWFAYLQRAAVVTIVFLYTVPTLSILFKVVVLPMSSASGALDISLWELTKIAVDHFMSDFSAQVLAWTLASGVIAHVIAYIIYESFEPETVTPETREQTRARVRADMKYSDNYFD